MRGIEKKGIENRSVLNLFLSYQMEIKHGAISNLVNNFILTLPKKKKMTQETTQVEMLKQQQRERRYSHRNNDSDGSGFTQIENTKWT